MKKCPYSHDGKCDIWIDYEVLRYAQDESNELLHSNWSEIVYLLDRVRTLEKYIVSIGGASGRISYTYSPLRRLLPSQRSEQQMIRSPCQLISFSVSGDLIDRDSWSNRAEYTTKSCKIILSQSSLSLMNGLT